MAEIILAKITPKTINGGKKVKRPEETDPVKWMYRIVGVATGSRTGEGTYGQWVGLEGTFQALRYEDGAVFRAGQCFLPQVALNLVLPVLKVNNAVEFAFNVGIQFADSQIGYEYTVEPLIEAEENDPINNLLKKIPDANKIARLEHKKDKKTA